MISAEWRSRFLSVALRVVAMLSRFTLIFVLAKVLEPSEVGLFGLFMATVAFSMLIVGGDYYTYSLRELLSFPRDSWSFVVQHQLMATLVLYLVLLPPQLLLFFFDLLPGRFLLWFFALVVVEHMAQEVNRILVAISRPVIAGWVLFIRMGLWVWFLMLIFALEPSSRNLDVTLGAWLVGGVVALSVGAVGIIRGVSPWHFWSWDWAWLKRGFGVGLVFLTATLCFKGLTTLDRYVVEALLGPEILGVYVFYIGMAMAIVSFLDAAVFSFLYPRLVRAYREGDVPTYLRIRREMVLSVVVVSVSLAALIFISSPFIVDWIGRDIYGDHLSLLGLLLCVSVVYGLGMIPHYGLYSRGADTSILVAHVSSLVVFGVAVVALAEWAPMMAVGIGLLASFSWMGVFKLVQYLRFGLVFGDSFGVCKSNEARRR